MPKVSKESATQGGDFGPVTDRSEVLEGYTVNFASFREDVDATPLMNGLPDDRCQCPALGLRRQRARSRSGSPTARRCSRRATRSTPRPATSR